MINVINQCNSDYLLESSLNACSEITHKGLNHKKYSGGKMEDACKIQSVFCWKICAQQMSSLELWEFLHISAQTFCPIHVAKQTLWPHVALTPSITFLHQEACICRK